jgi:hypothetical protein
MKSLLLGALVMGFCSIAAAKGATKADTITGEVVDITCYAAHQGKGEKHAACAQKCLTSGSPAGLVSDGKLWVVVMKDHSPLSPKLAAFAGKMVTAEGSKITVDGANIFEIDTFAAAK